MSVYMTDDSLSITTPHLPPNAIHVSKPPNDSTTYRKAMNEIRSRIKTASRRAVHIYSFNVPSEQLELAYALLDKEEQRRAMRVTYSDDHNFIVRYMPGAVHEEAHAYWYGALCIALVDLTLPPRPPMPPGCKGIATTTFQLGPRRKQADAGFRPSRSIHPSIILEVGSSESLGQLRIDARLWIEHMPEVELVIILLINCLPAVHPNLPGITIELWRGHAPSIPLCSQAAGNREAHVVWEADWTHNATPMYILLSDIFRGQVPGAYGINDRVNLDTVAWRQAIIDSCR